MQTFGGLGEHSRAGGGASFVCGTLLGLDLGALLDADRVNIPYYDEMVPPRSAYVRSL